MRTFHTELYEEVKCNKQYLEFVSIFIFSGLCFVLIHEPPAVDFWTTKKILTGYEKLLTPTVKGLKRN